MRQAHRITAIAGAAALLSLYFLQALAMDRAQGLTTPDTTREAYSQAMPGLSDAQREQFFRGRALFQQSWVVAPAKDAAFAGLGPLYNRLACVSCHAKNGRGVPPESPDERMLSMLVRLSIPGTNEHGGPRPHPAYGDQLNEEGIPGVPGEGRAVLTWIDRHVSLPDGTDMALRHPQLEIREPAYGPLDDVMTSLRVGQSVIGMGLLEAVPESTLRTIAAEQRRAGINGRLNRVWDPERRRMAVGRFGHKANMPSLRVQIAGAFVGDLGITSPIFPRENCTPVQTACQTAPSGGHPELKADRLGDITFYLAHLAVPQPRDQDRVEVVRGRQLFDGAGCALCHRPTLTTGRHPAFPRFSGQTIHPYTDLLIHDMGEGLADHRPDFAADGRSWRTAPLWGIGLSGKVAERERYLHDGRARSLEEAVLWHGGEGEKARNAYAGLTPKDRAALIEFLKSL